MGLSMEHFYQEIDGWFCFKKQYEKIFSLLPNEAVWVEVGSYCGRSIAWLLVEMENNNKNFTVYAVDNWQGNDLEQFYIDKKNIDPLFFENFYEKFKNNLSRFEGKFTPIKMLSWDAANQFQDESIDYVMIDAGHDYESVKKDIAAWWPKIKKGGYMGGDDYAVRNPQDGVFLAVNEFVSKNSFHLNLLDNYKKTGNISKKNKNWLIRK